MVRHNFDLKRNVAAEVILLGLAKQNHRLGPRDGQHSNNLARHINIMRGAHGVPNLGAPRRLIVPGQDCISNQSMRGAASVATAQY